MRLVSKSCHTETMTLTAVVIERSKMGRHILTAGARTEMLR